MTIALYARQKGWPLTGVTVRLRHSRIHAEDCAECETKRALLDRIEREITVAGASDAYLGDQHSNDSSLRTSFREVRGNACSVASRRLEVRRIQVKESSSRTTARRPRHRSTRCPER